MVAHTPTRGRRVAIVAAARTPLAKAGTDLKDVHATDLARIAFQETLWRAGWPADKIDEVILGNVIMPADATNPARVAALRAGIPHHVPALTVQRNCASGMEAIGEAALKIRSGRATAILAGGAESMSQSPLLFPEETAEPLGQLARARSLGQRLAALARLRPRHFKPVPSLLVGLTDPVVGLIMGQTAEVLAHEFGISRVEQDAYALRSHRRAAEAIEAGRFADEITPVAHHGHVSYADVGPRANQSMDALAKLKPIFDRRDGTVTVGNACSITDGACAMLLMDAELARAEGLPIMGYVQAYATAGLDPARMGLGPVYALDRLLRDTGLSMKDLELMEINEAFAAQVLACMRAADSDQFGREALGRSSALGAFDEDRLNVNGGAIALGHPVGATGARITLDLLLEMERRQMHLGVATLCVGGGQGAAILIGRDA